MAATLGFVYLLNPATGPVNVVLASSGSRARSGSIDPTWSKPSLLLLGALGRRQHDDHLPRRDPRRADSSSTSRPSSTGRASGAAALGDAAVDQPGDPLRGRARDDPGAAVLHAGVRRRKRRRRPGVAGRVDEITVGYPEDSTLFYPVLLYQHGFRYFNMGYASAMAMVLLVAAFVLTLAIILTSRRWVHYQGATR